MGEILFFFCDLGGQSAARANGRRARSQWQRHRPQRPSRRNRDQGGGGIARALVVERSTPRSAVRLGVAGDVRGQALHSLAGRDGPTLRSDFEYEKRAAPVLTLTFARRA